MRSSRVVAVIALSSSMVLGWQMSGADRTGWSAFERTEAVRLRAHFTQVERELLARDVSALAPARREARAEQIAQLRRYAARGEFPRNDMVPGTSVPIFRDSRGYLCAMAFLIAASGRGDITDHVARTRNNGYVPDLVDEPGLAQWLTDHGLTVAEAARIQPSYPGNPCCTIPDDPAPSKAPPITAGYAFASGTLGVLSGLSLAWNAHSLDRVAIHRWRGMFGLGVGGLTMALGVSRIDEQGFKNQSIGMWNIVLGAASAVLGGRALLARPRSAASAAPRLQIVPVVSGGQTPRLGVAGHLRF